MLDFGQIQNMILIRNAETSTNSMFIGTTYNVLKERINQAYFKIASLMPWEFFAKNAIIPLVLTTISASSTGTALTVTSTSGFGRKRWIWVTDGTNTELVQIASVDSATGITLEGTGLANTYTSGYVSLENYFLPYDCQKVMDIRQWGSTPSRIQIVDTHAVDREIPKIKTTGAVTAVYIGGKNIEKEPATGSNTADATTSTTAIVDSSLTGISNDYYNGWLAYNITRKTAERVTDYVVSTKTLTLKNAITGQVATDTYYLMPYLNEFRTTTIPIEASTLHVRYRRMPDKLVNDYDIPEIPEQYHDLIFYKAMIDILAIDIHNPRTRSDTALFMALYKELYDKMVDDNMILAETHFESVATGYSDENEYI